MNKPAKILQLLQLLNHRSYVTMDMIRSTCGIPERTAYRYLNTISEADIPIYFDRNVAGYRLAEENRFRLDDLTSDELSVLAACLQLIQGHVNSRYRTMLRRIWKKVAVRQPAAVEEIISALRPSAQDGVVDPDYSEQLSLVLIQMAASCQLPITLTLSAEGADATTVPVKSPSLCFRNDWQVAGTDRPEEVIGNLRQVEFVAIG